MAGAVVPMAFHWDERKNQENARKHGLRFEDAISIWSGKARVLEFPDERHDYGEERQIAIGLVKGRVIVVVFVDRGGNRRLISARKATTDEAEIYFETSFGRARQGRRR